MPVAALIVLLASGGVAALVTWLVRERAGGFGLVQTPNARSSHVRPTPSGGGIGIVAGGTVLTLFLLPAAPLSIGTILVAALLVAFIGLWDDRHGLRVTTRLPGQALAFALVISLSVGADRLGLALGFAWPLVMIVALVVGVYWLNLFNFMDGIDGIAASEALFLFAAAAGLLLSDLTPESPALILWCLGLAAATAGFLIFNWAPASIFMGDVGSTYLGFMVAAIGLITIADGAISLAAWSILTSTFVADATVTLVRRIARGENPTVAHRRHAYQFLARRWGSHARVTLLFSAINVIVLLPLAAWAQSEPESAPWLVAAVYIALGGLVFAAGAGRPEHA